MKQTKRSTVLVVDDNQLIIELMIVALQDQYKIQVALDGRSTLESVSTNPPDIILLDISMPGMDGYEVCRILKKDERTKDIPVIFTTSKDQEEDETKGFDCGAVDYINKPVSHAILKARLRTHLELRDQNKALEEKVLERTWELKKSMIKAEEASRAKAAFLANMSHELRTPLNHIIGLSSLLMELEIESKHKELIATIYNSGQQLTAILNNLLALSSLESGKKGIQYTDFLLMRAIKEQSDIFHRIAMKKQLRFRCTIEPNMPVVVWGAPVETMQVLSHILNNAFQYTEYGGVTLDIRKSTVNESSMEPHEFMLKISVSDTGVGISNDKLETIFNSFEIGEDFMTKRLSGSGVGLTISKKLIEKMNGKIKVESQVGKGSTFTISLPFKEVVESKTLSAIRESGLAPLQCCALIDCPSDLDSVSNTGEA